MNKAELVSRVARDAGLTKADVLRVLDAFVDNVVRSLRKAEKVKLVDFGTFLVTRRRARQGHDPHSGQAIRIGARRWPRFAPGKALRQAVREGAGTRSKRARAAATESGGGETPPARG
jgi:DNA-binding protein HU-beta